jgi:hypothetical protein
MNGGRRWLRASIWRKRIAPVSQSSKSGVNPATCNSSAAVAAATADATREGERGMGKREKGK